MKQILTIKEPIGKMNKLKNSLGCGKEFCMNSSIGFICGVANAWGKKKLCKDCKLKEMAR